MNLLKEGDEMSKIARMIKRRIDYDEMEKQPVKVEPPWILGRMKEYEKKLREAQEKRGK